MPDDEKDLNESEKPVKDKKGGFNIDPEKFKFTLNLTAIFALVFAVYQLTNFVWRNYHDLEKRIHTIEIKYETIQSQFELLDQKFKTNLETSEKTKSKLNEIEEFVNQNLKNGNQSNGK